MSDKYDPAVLHFIKDSFIPSFVFHRAYRIKDFFRSTADQFLSIEKIRYGAGTEFGENVVLEKDVVIGKNCYIGSGTVIRNGVVIGDNSIVGHLCVIEEGTKIGSNSTIQSQCHITAFARICDNVFFGPCVCCINDTKMVKYHPERGDFIPRGPVFMSGCSIGARSVILPGVAIGENAIIGAGSVVANDVPSGETWIGNKAHVLKKALPDMTGADDGVDE